MAKFRTTLDLSAATQPIRYSDKLLSIGSCFAENIGQRLLDYKFQLQLNPFGITYNPASVAKSLSCILSDKIFDENDLFYDRECWHSPAHHSRFSSSIKEVSLDLINYKLMTAREYMQELDVLILTFGTAHVFHQLKGKGFRPNVDQHIVNNCHKLPADCFERRLMSVAEITSALQPVLQQIKSINPNVRVMLTVSPVRHIRDGLVESKLSKSTLLVAMHQLCQDLDFATYFPAYELVIDDLRDYRFYKEDMVHPSKVAVDYVWEQFSKVHFQEAEQALMQRIGKLNQAMKHRPFNPESKAHQQFLRQQLAEVHRLQEDFLFLDFTEEEEYFGEEDVDYWRKKDRKYRRSFF